MAMMVAMLMYLSVLPSTAPTNLNCGATWREQPKRPGERTKVFTCPDNCLTKATDANVIYGDVIYHWNSSLCLAAIHSGAISNDAGWDFLLFVLNGAPSYESENRHNITSQRADGNEGSYERAFFVRPYAVDETTLKAKAETNTISLTEWQDVLMNSRMVPTNSTKFRTNSTTVSINSTMVATNSTTVSTNSTMVSTDSTTASIDSKTASINSTQGMTTMASTDSTTASTDSMTASTDSTMVSSDSTTVSTNSMTASTDSTMASTDSMTASTNSKTTSTNSMMVSTDSMTVSTNSMMTSTDSMMASTDSTTASTDSTTASTNSMTASTNSMTASTDSTTASTDSMTASTNSTMVSSDSTTVSTNSMTASTDSTMASTDSTTASTNSKTASTNSMMVSTDSTTVSTNSMMTSTDSMTASTNSTTVSTDSTTACMDSTTAAINSTTPSMKGTTTMASTNSTTVSSNSTMVFTTKGPTPSMKGTTTMASTDSTTVSANSTMVSTTKRPTTSTKEPTPPTEPTHKLWIVVIIVVLTLLVLVVLACLLLLKRHWKDGMQLPWKKRADPPPHITVIGQRTMITNDGSTSNIMMMPLRPPTPEKPKSIPVSLSDFMDYVKDGYRDSNIKYALQYEDLKMVGREQSKEHALMVDNRPKNRFTNILPYDHSRVKLLPVDDDEASDYINANYMPGYNSPREYIVTQGPLASTALDFWRMVWEQNVQAIIMVTRCQEKGREKCFSYWPMETQTPVVHGDLEVTSLSFQESQDWRITQVNLDLGDTESRKLVHYNYTAWPDFGVPKEPSSLVAFVRTIRARCKRGKGPILVHCSAGVGRSGTYIALDWALQQMVEHDSLDLYGMIYKMRLNRTSMVQTESQFIFLHECVSRVLQEEAAANDLYLCANVNQAFEPDDGICDSPV